MKKIEHRDYFKENIWKSLSSKDYPGMNDRCFLKIILKKAQKTYYEYVSFYQNIGIEGVGDIKQLKRIGHRISKIFDLVNEVRLEFHSLIIQIKLTSDFLKLSNDLEDKSFNIWKEIISLERKALLAA